MQDFKKKIINLLFIHGEEISIDKISEILVVNQNEILNLLDDIKRDLNSIGLDLLINNKNILITTSKEYSFIIENLKKYELNSELTPAQLQTLTIVAYLGPINLSKVSYIRGVQSSQVLRSLSTRGLIKKENTEYSITTESMKYLGITNIKELPMFEEIKNKLEEKLKESLNQE